MLELVLLSCLSVDDKLVRISHLHKQKSMGAGDKSSMPANKLLASLKE